MTSIVPNRSIVTGVVVSRAGGSIELDVQETHPAWPKIADLVARMGTRVTIRIAPSRAAAPGDRIELQCEVVPGSAGGGAPELQEVP